ncbi:hypothetical protein [Methylobacterium sp. J-070]|uniref:hypothetical protein n=1 Tax=Methylobacterium sp. J-070 TaxID=2836650 RepID=UPI001FBA2C40|nr:hypothetical protein [Methylobacterium sp. J-070]MCJ2050041.1 hypothetical protein [Methylobacterium sp. J-070]
MSKEHLTRIWQWASITGILFVLASVVSIQGGSSFLGKLVGDAASDAAANRPAIGFFAAVVGAGLLFVASFALVLHALRHGDRWHERVPVVWLEGLRTGTWDGSLYQAIVLLLFLALPAMGIGRSIEVAETGDICELNTAHFYKGSETTLLAPPQSASGNQMRLRREGAGQSPCTDGIELLPRFGTPALVYGLPLLGGGMALFALWAIFVRRSASTRNNSDDVAPLPEPGATL